MKDTTTQTVGSKGVIKMNKPYLILVNGLLWDRKLTKHGALKVVAFLRDTKGLNASYAYEITKETI